MVLYKIGDSMKLNKKGFAFSTMLYGCIALIAAVLYIILNVNKNSADTTYYYGEEILQDLNDCVTEEIALENCYSSGSATCNATAFHACLGVSDSNATDKGVIISESLKRKPNLVADTYVTSANRYIYTGMDPSNYIEFSGKLWRIVSIESDGSLLLIDINNYGNLAWDSDNKSVWDSSTLYYELNTNYVTGISDNSKAVNKSWNISLVYPSLTENVYNLYDLVSQETAQPTTSAKVGLLQLSDYLKATSNTACQNSVFSTSTSNCISWLSQYKGWVIDVEAERTTEDVGYAYYFGDGVVMINSTQNETQYNKPFVGLTNEQHSVYPVINLNRNSVLKGGSGTLADPYVLK